MWLTGEEKRLLRAALLDAFRTEDELRRLVLDCCGMHLDHFTHGALEPRVFQLIEEAEAAGWLSPLIDGARAERPGNALLSAFHVHYTAVRPARVARERADYQKLRERGTSIDPEVLAALEGLLVTDRLERDALVDAANRFDVWGTLTEPEDVPTAFRRIVGHLARLAKQSDGTLPLYTFAHELATRLGRQAEVHAWARSLPYRDLRLPPRRHASALYLFVKCRPAYTKDERREPPYPAGERLDLVHVEMWLWRLDEAGRALDEEPEKVCQRLRRSALAGNALGPGEIAPAPDVDQPVAFAQVAQLISDVRKQLTRELIAAKNNLSIALCVSQAALPVDVERWDIVVGTTSSPIGIEHPVSIRSYERLYGGREDTWGKWASKWDQLRMGKGSLLVWGLDEAAAPATSGSSACSRPQTDTAGTAFQTAAHRPDTVCAALTHAAGVSLVARTIDAGIPAVVWTRGSQHPPSEVRSRLEPVLAGYLSDLPHHFHQRRGDADPFDRIALLWEPYDRLPPDTLEFAAPDRL